MVNYKIFIYSLCLINDFQKYTEQIYMDDGFMVSLVGCKAYKNYVWACSEISWIIMILPQISPVFMRDGLFVYRYNLIGKRDGCLKTWIILIIFIPCFISRLNKENKLCIYCYYCLYWLLSWAFPLIKNCILASNSEQTK